jgi:hypothetical protein
MIRKFRKYPNTECPTIRWRIGGKVKGKFHCQFQKEGDDTITLWITTLTVAKDVYLSTSSNWQEKEDTVFEEMVEAIEKMLKAAVTFGGYNERFGCIKIPSISSCTLTDQAVQHVWHTHGDEDGRFNWYGRIDDYPSDSEGYYAFLCQRA